MKLRRAIAAPLDELVLGRAKTLADRAKRGKYEPAKNRMLLETFEACAAPNGTKQPSPEYVESVAKAVEGLWDRSTGKIVPSARLRRAIVDQFHRIYYHSPKQTWQNTYYRGVRIWKCPLDLWLYQEIMQEIQPELIIETGTAYGGSAYYLADLCESFGRGRVVSIDIKTRPGHTYPEHPRLTYLLGSSTDEEIKKKALDGFEGGNVLVILDSAHKRGHVLNEMRLWNDTVPVGSYMIVEDSNVNGHPVHTRFGPGPWEAIDAFLKESSGFVVDESKHKFMMTQNPRGYLKRIR